MAQDQLQNAAEVAESRLGMSSLQLHGASHMAPLMPEEMRHAGTNMHRAASGLRLKRKKARHCRPIERFQK